MASEKDAERPARDELDTGAEFKDRRKMSTGDIEEAVQSGRMPSILSKTEAFEIARVGGWVRLLKMSPVWDIHVMRR